MKFVNQAAVKARKREGQALQLNDVGRFGSARRTQGTKMAEHHNGGKKTIDLEVAAFFGVTK